MTPVERLRAAEALLRDGVKWVGVSAVPPITPQRNVGIRIDPVVAWAMAEVLRVEAEMVERCRLSVTFDGQPMFPARGEMVALADALLGGGGA